MRVVLADPGTRTPPTSSLRGGAPAGGPGLAPGTRTSLRLALFGLAMLVAFASLRVALQGVLWWFVCAALVLVPLLAIGIAARLGRRPWQPALAGVVAGLAALTVGFAREQSLLGVIPTPGTVARWVELANAGSLSIANQRMPAVAGEGILFLLGILAVLSVVVIAPLLDWAPALAALPLLVVLDIPVAIRGGVAEPVWFVLVAVIYLGLLRVGRRRAPVRSVVAITALSLVGALVLPAAFPPAREPVRDGSGAFGTGLNPLINLGEDLRRETVVDALTYTTDAPAGLYLRLATLDQFTGLSWEPDTSIRPDADVALFPEPPGLGDDVPRYEYSADIEIQDVSGRWLPVPYPATSIEGLDGIWNWEPDGLAVRSGGADVRGQEYTVDFLDIEPNRDQLLADLEPDVRARALDLPDEMPEIIAATAAQVAGQGTAYDRAIALQEFFAGAQSDFQYSLDAPVENDFDGSGVGVIAEFLEARTGYCVHYASAMAVMARTVGIPSRVAVGFQPGERSGVGGTYVVTSNDMHAWPELYFEGIGWLRFEPTPGRGALPDYSSLEAVDDPDTPEFEGANPSASPRPTSSAAPSLPPEETETPEAVPGASETADPLPVVLLVLGGILAVLLVPAAVRAGIRARRMRRVRRGDASAAWDEVRDTAHDHDWVAPETETPRQLGDRLAIVVGDEAVTPLRAGVESAAYDRPGRESLSVEEVRALRRAIAAAATLRVRLLAIFAPPSLGTRLGIGRRPPEE